MLLPSDLCAPSDTVVSIADLSLVLQTDLVLPVTRDDQLMILKTYGSPSGDVDVQRLLSAAGVWYDGPQLRAKKPLGADAALARIHSGNEHVSTIHRTADDKRHARAEGDRAADARSKLTPEEQKYQDTLDQMHRPSQYQEKLNAQQKVQANGSAEYGLAMKEIADTIPEEVAHSKDKDAVTATDMERYEMRLKNLPGLLPETNTAKLYHGDVLARSAEHADALAAIHSEIAYEKRELDADEIAKRKKAQEEAALEASKLIKLPIPPSSEPAFPVLDRTSGLGLEIIPNISESPILEHTTLAPRSGSGLVVSWESKSTALGMKTQTIESPNKASRDWEGQPSLLAPPPVEHVPRNSNMTLKEAALLDENARLKQELKAFDGEFWEQLEDLKFRYNRLQGVVGQDTQVKGFLNGYGAEPPVVRPVDASSATFRTSMDSSLRRSGDKTLPLESVAWAKRNATTAMDSAALDTPLVKGRHPKPASAGLVTLNGVNSPPRTARSNLDKSETAFDPSRGQRAALHDLGYPERFGFEITSRNAPAGFSGRDPTRPAPQTMGVIGGESSARLPLLRHVAGGYPTGPLLGEKEGGQGSLASMCERKLLFELGNHPNPESASQMLIHRVMDLANSVGNRGRYLAPQQLVECISSVGLRMSAAEVTMFAAGFGSDGKGGIDCEELCEALQALLYNFVGEHDRLQGKRSERSKELQKEQSLEDELKALLNVVAEGILAHDKKAVLGAGKSVFDTLLDPFVRSDTPRAGVLPFSQWAEVMADIGCMLLRDEQKMFASYFEVGRAKAPAPESEEEIASFRERQVKSMLSGAAKADERFAAWLASSSTGIGLEDQDEPLIAYHPMCVMLADTIEKLIDNGGGLVAGPGAGSAIGGKGSSKEVDALMDGLWMLREFELIENLICQLELMKPNDRRRCLMSLQYALAAADTHNDGTIDGFSLLSALLGAGFRLQRLNRVRLLKAVEELGGKMNYSEFCQVLLRSCADWTSEERGLVTKILKSMGITVLERRAWLGRMRVSLMSAAVEYNKKQSALKANTLAAYTASSGQSGQEADPGIPPSNFLHVLRECGVVLTVEEEATLLDCLDTERLAELSALERKKKEKTVVTNQTFGAWGVPLVYYKSFLAFCSRHTGDWSDAAPETTTAVQEMLRAASEPMKGLHEFSSLLLAFDEGKTGKIGNRAFQIVCHRARLFANLSETEIRNLSDILTAEGGGSIRYTSFLIHLRVMCGKVTSEQNSNVPDITEQLLQNCTDAKNTLLPLRNWLLRHTDVESCKLSMKELNALLREFSVLYRPDDLQSLLMEIGSAGLQEQQSPDSPEGSLTGHDIDTRDLFRHLFKMRGPWMQLQPYLCERMVTAMTMTGAALFTTAPGEAPTTATTNAGANTFSFPKGPRGIETAAARRVLARLRAFTDVSVFDGAAMSSTGSVGGGEGRLVELDIFGSICKATGLPLSDEELLILADATDFHPLANRIRCDVVLEAISFKNSTTGAIAGSAESDKKKTKKSLMDQELSSSAAFALKHLKEQIWNTCKRLKRTADEWINDVNSVFRGFDNGGVGFITTDDFTMGLALLNAPCNADILRDIPSVPEGPGMISYKEILDALLVPPVSMFAGKDKDKNKGMGPAHSSGSGRAASQESKTADVSDRKNGAPKKSEKLTQEDKDKKERELAVNMLVTVVRKSIKTFIIRDSSLEEAWMCLVRAFRRFDPTESGKVAPRDFCLAVSVLLEGDEVLLTESQWTDIITYFTDAGNSKDKKKNVDTSHALGAPATTQQLVDYMEFCQTILDPKSCKEMALQARLSGGRKETNSKESKEVNTKSAAVKK